MSPSVGFSEPLQPEQLLPAPIGHNGGPTLNPILKPFWTAPVNEKGEKVRNRVLYGGRSSSKTWDAAGFAVFLAQRYKVKVLCVRQFQARIADSVYTIIKNTIIRFGLLSEFKILENSIVHRRTGSEFIFYGLWRHINEIRGTEGVDICWIEEGHALTEDQWRVLNPTLRSEASQFFIIFNPQLATDFVWKRFVINPPRGTLIRTINYDENPFLSQTMRDLIEDAKQEDLEEYEHVYLGVPRSDDDDAIIKRSWVMAAIDAHILLGIEPTGWDRVGFDVADKGKDKCAMIYAHGQLVSWSDLWKAQENEGLKSSQRAWNAAGQRGAQLIYDDIGVGATVGSHINAFNRQDDYGRPSAYNVRHKGFNAGGKVWQPDGVYARTRKKNQDMFANLKAQSWWHVANLFRNTFNAVQAFREAEKNGLPPPPLKVDPADLIFLSSEMANLMLLVDELATPRRDYDNSGKVKVESKADLAKPNRIGGPQPSPNCADALIMAFAPGQRPMQISAAALEAA
jgi:phage terminase large subunit